jgi:hypothetical protein
MINFILSHWPMFVLTLIVLGVIWDTWVKPYFQQRRNRRRYAGDTTFVVSRVLSYKVGNVLELGEQRFLITAISPNSSTLTVRKLKTFEFEERLDRRKNCRSHWKNRKI